MQLPKIIGRSLRSVTTRVAEVDFGGLMSRHPWITLGVGVGVGFTIGMVGARLVQGGSNVTMVMPQNAPRRRGVMRTFAGVLASTVAAETARRLASSLVFHATPVERVPEPGVAKVSKPAPSMTH